MLWFPEYAADSSVLVGPQALIDRARWFRKAFGGGWRQSGTLASMADYAVTNHFPRLASTHVLARKLGTGLKEHGLRILAPVDTNMVFFGGLDPQLVIDRLGALESPILLDSNRCVIHHQTSPEAVDQFIAVIGDLVKEHGVSEPTEDETLDY